MPQARAPEIAAIVLAAGRSERLGQPKALCVLQGETLLSRALANVQDPRVRRAVVVAPADLERALVVSPEVRVVANDRPELGPSWSVRLGIDAIGEGVDGYLVLPVDCPLVRRDDVGALLDAMQQEQAADVRLWVPSFDGRRGHPLLVHRDLAPEIRALGPGEPLHQVVRADALRVHHVAAAHDGVLFDVDTPGDLEEAARRLGGGSHRQR